MNSEETHHNTMSQKSTDAELVDEVSPKVTRSLEPVRSGDPLRVMATPPPSVPQSPDIDQRQQTTPSQGSLSNISVSGSPSIPGSPVKEIHYIRANSKRNHEGSPMASSAPKDIPVSLKTGSMVRAEPNHMACQGSEFNSTESDVGWSNGALAYGTAGNVCKDPGFLARQAKVMAAHRIRTDSQRSVVSTTAAEKGNYSAKPSLRSMMGSAFDPNNSIKYGSRFGSGNLFGTSTTKMSDTIDSCTHVNYVVEATSVLPSLSSVFSIEDFIPVDPNEWLDKNEDELAEPGQVSSSVGEHLQHLDILDDPAYTDTVKSTDSVGSLLRRSLSVPSNYIREPRTIKRHVAEIFEDFFPPPDGTEKNNVANANVVEGKKWKQTMDDLIEYPEYIDSLDSTSSKTGLLARHAKIIAMGEKPPLTPSEDLDEGRLEEFKIAEKKQCIKNLFVLSLSFAFLFTAYLSLRNVASSLYDVGGLGLYALGVVYASLFLGCIVAPTIIEKFRPKKTMLACFSAIAIYMVANFYPSFYTIIPTASLVGFALSNLWTAHATYLTNIAATYAGCTNSKVGDVLSKFNGVFFLFFQMSQLLGGIITSLILNRGPVHDELYGTNQTYYEFENVSGSGIDSLAMCGAKYCHMDTVAGESLAVDKKTHYTLIGIYAGLAVTGLVVLLIFLDRLEGKMKKSHKTIGTQLVAVFKFFYDRRVLMLSGLMFYSLLQISFMFGEFTKAFVTCELGLHMVGYSMVCLSACAAISSFCAGRLQQYVGILVLFITAGCIDLALLLTMLFWQPTAETTAPVIFALAGVWGIGDGIYITQTVSLFGVLFSDNKEPAFAALKMCQALGACLMFVVGPYLCTKVKIYILMGVLAYAMIGYSALEITQRKQAKFKPPFLIHEINITAKPDGKVAV